MMVYDTHWLEAERVLQVVFHADITQEDVRCMVHDVQKKLSSTSQTVHVVVDAPSGYSFPKSIKSLIPMAKQYYQIPNLGCTMLVTGNMALWTFAKMISQISVKRPRFITARTLNAVLNYLNEHETDTSANLSVREARAG